MAKLKITAATVSEIMETAKPNKNTFYFDTEIAGFGFYRTPGNVGTFFAEYRPVAGGSKKRIKLGRVGTLKANEAREAARRAISNAALGKDLAKDRADERSSVTIKTLVANYIAEFVAKNKKASSANYYETIAKKHIYPHLGSIKATSLTRVEVQRAHSAMTKTARVSANRSIKLVAAAFNWGARHGHVPEGFNPASGVELNKERGRERYLNPDEMLRLGNALHEAETVGFAVNAGDAKHAPKGQRTRFHPSVTGAIRLLMLTGCRLREILHLEWTHVDAERGLLNLPDSKTGKKTVVLSQAAREVVAGLPRVGRYVIAGRGEEPRADLKRPWATLSKAAQIDGVRLHDLRHTFASVGAGSDLGLPIIGALLGHADAKTTQRYAHVAVDASRRATDIIGAQIAAAMNGGRNG